MTMSPMEVMARIVNRETFVVSYLNIMDFEDYERRTLAKAARKRDMRIVITPSDMSTFTVCPNEGTK